MRVHRFTAALIVLNAVFLLVFLAQIVSAAAPTEPPVMRVRAMELVDARGQVRAQLNVESGGEVVLRLRDANGAVRVKLGASEKGSGLLLANDYTEPGVHILAQDGGASLTLRNKDGRQQLIKP
jgi:hypothetical protein